MVTWNENFTCYMHTGNDCHALSFVQQMPMPSIGLGGVVRLKVT